MSYLVLARKWRPRTFQTLVGQEHVVKALSNALNTQRLHHAWLFTGTRGVGKTTLARLLAKSLNCEKGISASPCGTCQACTEIDAGSFVDYLEFDAASNRRVEEMTQLLEQAIYSPSVGRFKIYTIDEVHMLTGHAFNAMLKTLEEPPAHVKFILATTDPQKIPVTVLSRCLQFNLKQMTPEAIVSHLQYVLGEEDVRYDNEGLRLLAQAATGSMRDALSLTDQAIAYSGAHITADAVRDMLGTIDQRYLLRFLEQLLAGSAQGLIDVANELTTRGFSFSSALEDFASLLSRIAIEQRLPGTIGKEDPSYEDIVQLSQVLQADVLQLFYSIAIHSRAELALSPDEYTGFVMAGLRMLSLVNPQQLAQKKTPKLGQSKVSARCDADEEASVTVKVEYAESEKASTSSNAIPEVVDNVAADIEVADEAIEPKVVNSTVEVSADNVVPTTVEPENITKTAVNKESSPPFNNENFIPAWEDYPPDVVEATPHTESTFESNTSIDDIAVPQNEDDSYFIMSSSSSDESVSEPHHQEQHYSLHDMSPEKWVSIAQSWKLTGMIGQIVSHTEWVGVDHHTITMRLLMRVPDNLMAKTKLQTLLTEYFKTIITLKFEVGQTDQTAHAANQIKRQEQQQQAEAYVANNDLIKALQKECQANIVPGSIQPYIGD